MQIDNIDKMRKSLNTLLLAAVAIAIVVWAGYAYLVFAPFRFADSAKQEDQVISVIINYGDGAYSGDSIAVAASTTVLSAVQQLALAANIAFEYKMYPGMGALVTAIGPKQNGAGGAYWQYWVNGVYAAKAADQVMVQAGDRIEWKFAKQP